MRLRNVQSGHDKVPLTPAKSHALCDHFQLKVEMGSREAEYCIFKIFIFQFLTLFGKCALFGRKVHNPTASKYFTI